MKRDYDQCSIEIISVQEPFIGRGLANVLFRQIAGAFAQYGRAQIAARTSCGRRQKASRGGCAGGNAALEYHAARDTKTLQVDAAKAETVKRILIIRREQPNVSLRKTADILNGEDHEATRDRAFTPTQVKRVLEMEDLYRGIYHYAGLSSEGQYQAIVR